MPRPSSGEARAKEYWGGLTDKDLLWLTARPSHGSQAYMEAQFLANGISDDPGFFKEVAKNLLWRRYGTSYIVDELIGGPWDD